jgi:hypothetical protein
VVPLNVGTDQHYWTEGAEAIDGRSAPSAHGNNVVRTLIPVLDSFIGGLRPNHLTLIDSADRLLFDLTHMLCVNGVGVLNSDVVWIDGGNSVDPYEIGRVCRRFGRDRDEVLDSVRVARAFTAYQLVSLIDERLEDELERTGAGMVVLSCLPDLFLDKELRWSESYSLLRQCVEKTLALTRRKGLVTLITNLGLMKIVQRKSLKNLLYGTADDIIRIERASRALRISLPNRQEWMLYHPVPRYQTTLEEFMR